MTLLLRGAGLVICGAVIAWLFALFHGFTPDAQLCFDTAHDAGCGSSITWTDRRLLWLAPVVILVLLVMLAVVSAVHHPFGRSAAALAGIVVVAVLIVGGANGANQEECSQPSLAAQAAAANGDQDALVAAILSKPACFSKSDVSQARAYRHAQN